MGNTFHGYISSAFPRDALVITLLNIGVSYWKIATFLNNGAEVPTK